MLICFGKAYSGEISLDERTDVPTSLKLATNLKSLCFKAMKQEIGQNEAALSRSALRQLTEQ